MMGSRDEGDNDSTPTVARRKRGLPDQATVAVDRVRENLFKKNYDGQKRKELLVTLIANLGNHSIAPVGK